MVADVLPVEGATYRLPSGSHVLVDVLYGETSVTAICCYLSAPQRLGLAVAKGVSLTPDFLRRWCIRTDL